MDTKLKNYDDYMGEENITPEKKGAGKRLFHAVTSNGLRIAAFIILCVSAFFMLGGIINQSNLACDADVYAGFAQSSGIKYTSSYSYQANKDRLYQVLCATATTYLRNCNGGEYKGSKELLENLNNQLKQYASGSDIKISADDNGYPVIESDSFDFYVSFKDGGIITNIDSLKNSTVSSKEIEAFKENKCWYIRYHNETSSDENYCDENLFSEYYITNDYSATYSEECYSSCCIPIGWSGLDNYGRYIMCYGPFGDLYVYDFDTSDSEYSHIIDGYVTKKVESESNDDYYDYYSYDAYGNAYAVTQLENTDNYTFTPLSDSYITVLICPKQDLLAAKEAAYTQLENQSKLYIKQIIASGAVFCATLLYLLILCGYRNSAPKGKRWCQVYFIGGWCVEALLITGAAAGFLAALSIDFHSEGETLICKFFDLSTSLANNLICAEAVVAGSFALSALLAIICKFKSRTFIRDFCCAKLLAKLFKKLRKVIKESGLFKAYEKETLSRKLFIREWIFIGITVIFLIVDSLFYYNAGCSSLDPLGIIAIIVYINYLVWFIMTQFRIYKDLSSFEQQIDDINSGEEISSVISESSPLHRNSVKLERLSENIKKTVEKQVQSERMKVELVTNVSHDLKTPLTSIISYIDLLKSEEMSPAAEDYVKILEQKSDKLKNIVSDVFSLAKATSGVDVSMEPLDAVILLNQALADSADKIEHSDRKLMSDIQPDTAPIIGDGSKLCRVFQNLIDNALNYSMEGTRIFLTMKEESNRFTIEIKNIASYEMNFTPEEITERFTRGDKSRTDGGNGLGLSIAKSFTEACGGTFAVKLDGDVFKAQVVLFRR